MTELPASVVAPLGAIIAACITGTISFIGLVISKEQKTSEFRQAWIDALRADLSEFASQARRLAHERTPFDIRRLTGSLFEQMDAEKEEILRPDPLLVNRQRFAQTYYSLRLRLNPDEDDHRQLLAHLEKTLQILSESAESERPDQVAVELDATAHVARAVLGEPLYRLSLGIAAGLTIAFGVVIGIVVVVGLSQAYGGN